MYWGLGALTARIPRGRRRNHSAKGRRIPGPGIPEGFTGDAAYCLQNGQLNSKADLIPAGDHLGYVQNSSIRCLPCSLLAAGTRPPGRATRSRRSGRVRTSQYPNTPVLHIPHPTSHIPPTASRGRCLGRCPPTWLALPAAWFPFSRRDDLEEQTPVPSRVFYDQ